jgi:hypothetical protein
MRRTPITLNNVAWLWRGTDRNYVNFIPSMTARNAALKKREFDVVGLWQLWLGIMKQLNNIGLWTIVAGCIGKSSSTDMRRSLKKEQHLIFTRRLTKK